MKRLIVTLMLAAGPLCALAALAAPGPCPPYVKHNPGGDYHDSEDRLGLTVVETFHFTPKVEALVQGASGALGADIGYTLDHFPNHPRALAAMAKLGLRDKTPQPHGATHSLPCYFERAVAYRPNDAKVRMLYGAYLLAGGQQDAAMVQMQEALRLNPDDPTTNYNLGLMYVKRKKYPEALLHAKKAYQLGFPLPGLRNQLQAAGKWQP